MIKNVVYSYLCLLLVCTQGYDQKVEEVKTIIFLLGLSS